MLSSHYNKGSYKWSPLLLFFCTFYSQRKGFAFLCCYYKWENRDITSSFPVQSLGSIPGDEKGSGNTTVAILAKKASFARWEKVFQQQDSLWQQHRSVTLPSCRPSQLLPVAHRQHMLLAIQRTDRVSIWCKIMWYNNHMNLLYLCSLQFTGQKQ